MIRISCVQAAAELARDRVLNDPTDDDIVLAAVELAKGRWPEEGIDRSLRDRILRAYAVAESEMSA